MRFARIWRWRRTSPMARGSSAGTVIAHVRPAFATASSATVARITSPRSNGSFSQWSCPDARDATSSMSSASFATSSTLRELAEHTPAVAYVLRVAGYDRHGGAEIVGLDADEVFLHLVDLLQVRTGV